MPPLELFSLEEEATLLPGGLFVSLFSLSRAARGTILRSHCERTHGTVADFQRIICCALLSVAGDVQRVSKVL